MSTPKKKDGGKKFRWFKKGIAKQRPRRTPESH
jgi:hypothetical protein